MKNTNIKRQAVFPILMMLVVTALALIGSSFAWFTVANTATVAQITTSAQSDGVRLELSKNATRYYTRSIDVNNGAISAVLPNSLYQVSTTGLLEDKDHNNLSTLEFFNSKYNGYSVTDGKEYIVSKKDTTVTESLDGKLAATTRTANNYGLQGDSYGEAEGATQPTYIVFDLYFSTDRKADIYFFDSTAIKGKDANAADYSDDADVLKALRVAVVYLGSTETASEVVALDGSLSNSVAIWQVLGNDTVYGINKESYNDGENGSEAEFESYKDNSGYVNNAGVTTYGSELIVGANKDTAGKTKLFSTPAPSNDTVERVYSKVRVYVWLEGQDPDCLSKVASQDIQINLAFFAKDATV